MDTLNDDVLTIILGYVHYSENRNSIAQVSKRFQRLERLTRRFLSVQEPDLLYKLLPTFPNLIQLELWKPINNSHLETLSKTCPRLEVLNLGLPNYFVGLKLFKLEFAAEDDFDVEAYDDEDDSVGDGGIAAIAKGCPNLEIVDLTNRREVGNLGVISLVTCAMNLTTLNLRQCELITDSALQAIGESKSIMVLNLQGCSRITDCGLAFLANGSVSKNLKTLVIARCNQITTDSGVSLLQSMCCLEVLDMENCGFGCLADIGCLAIATNIGGTLKKLNLTGLSITDDTVIALARNCLNLTSLNLTGCWGVSGVGLGALSNHGSLRSLTLSECGAIDGKDVEHLVLRSPNLREIVLSLLLAEITPKSVLHNIKKCCAIGWTA